MWQTPVIDLSASLKIGVRLGRHLRKFGPVASLTVNSVFIGSQPLIDYFIAQLSRVKHAPQPVLVDAVRVLSS